MYEPKCTSKVCFSAQGLFIYTHRTDVLPTENCTIGLPSLRIKIEPVALLRDPFSLIISDVRTVIFSIQLLVPDAHSPSLEYLFHHEKTKTIFVLKTAS